MAVKKKDGVFFQTRGSNHKYSQLDDIDEIKRLLLVDCPADVARSIGVPYNSLRYLIVTKLSQEEQDLVNWKRRRHKNKVVTR